MEIAILALGCFWGPEIKFSKIPGIKKTEVGYCGGENQKKIAEKVHKDINERLSGKVVTKISLLKNYCPAEEYHQKYLEKR